MKIMNKIHKTAYISYFIGNEEYRSKGIMSKVFNEIFKKAKNNFNLKLNNITELTEKSLIHNKSYSPSNATLNSTTSILMQTKTSGSIIKDYKFIVLNEKNDQINFDFEKSLYFECFF